MAFFIDRLWFKSNKIQLFVVKFRYGKIGFFDMNTDVKPAKKMRIHRPRPVRDMPAAAVKYKNALQLADDIGMMADVGERVFAVIDGSFIFGDFIEAFLVKTNYLCKRMVISTLSLSQENVDSLKNLFEGGYLERLDLIISDHFYTHERHVLVPYLYQELDSDSDRFQLAVARTHTKICLIETECGKRIVIHGSANLRSSGNMEMFEIEHCPSLHQFNVDWHDEIIAKYSTIRKTVRRIDSWQADQKKERASPKSKVRQVQVVGADHNSEKPKDYGF